MLSNSQRNFLVNTTSDVINVLHLYPRLRLPSLLPPSSRPLPSPPNTQLFRASLISRLSGGVYNLIALKSSAGRPISRRVVFFHTTLAPGRSEPAGIQAPSILPLPPPSSPFSRCQTHVQPHTPPWFLSSTPRLYYFFPLSLSSYVRVGGVGRTVRHLQTPRTILLGDNAL